MPVFSTVSRGDPNPDPDPDLNPDPNPDLNPRGSDCDWLVAGIGLVRGTSTSSSCELSVLGYY